MILRRLTVLAYCWNLFPLCAATLVAICSSCWVSPWLCGCLIADPMQGDEAHTRWRTPSPDYTYRPRGTRAPVSSPILWLLVPVWLGPPMQEVASPATLSQYVNRRWPPLPRHPALEVENYIDWLLQLLVLPVNNNLQFPRTLAHWQHDLQRRCNGYRLNWRQAFVVYGIAATV